MYFVTVIVITVFINLVILIVVKVFSDCDSEGKLSRRRFIFQRGISGLNLLVGVSQELVI